MPEEPPAPDNSPVPTPAERMKHGAMRFIEVHADTVRKLFDERKEETGDLAAHKARADTDSIEDKYSRRVAYRQARSDYYREDRKVSPHNPDQPSDMAILKAGWRALKQMRETGITQEPQRIHDFYVLLQQAYAINESVNEGDIARPEDTLALLQDAASRRAKEPQDSDAPDADSADVSALVQDILKARIDSPLFQKMALRTRDVTNDDNIALGAALSDLAQLMKTAGIPVPPRVVNGPNRS